MTTAGATAAEPGSDGEDVETKILKVTTLKGYTIIVQRLGTVS